jgi:hypothetical protein|tara:strand:+ start:6551 stop:6979 length:429 start_codon:yes stop_codon:yes gene_type:complete
MADQGFICSDEAVTGINDGYVLAKKILLHEDSAVDSNSRAMPSACHWSHLEIHVSSIATSAATLTCYLTWDSIGDYPATSESDATTIVVGLTEATDGGVAISLDVNPTFPTVATTTGKVYLHVKTDTGTVTVGTARLYWNVD